MFITIFFIQIEKLFNLGIFFFQIWPSILDVINNVKELKIQINKDSVFTSLGTCEIEEITSQLKGKISLSGKVDMEDYQATLNDKLEFNLNGVLSDGSGGDGVKDEEKDAENENSSTTTTGDGPIMIFHSRLCPRPFRNWRKNWGQSCLSAEITASI